MPALPKDFSPELYLQLNPDVLAAGVDPAAHYLKHGIAEGRQYTDVRKKKLLGGLELSSLVGVEIGALCRPFVKAEDGEIIYVDHADTPTLAAKYGTDPDVDINKLVHVNAVWGQNTLRQAVAREVDYVVASHVIEHVPDLIGWLSEIEETLVSGGELRLIVPDKRYTFDYLRRETILADVVYASIVKTRLPLPHLILDYVMNVSKVNAHEAWAGKLNESTVERHHSVEHAIAVANDARLNGAYHDIHCWVFTPLSFAHLMEALVGQGLLHMECTMFHDTQHGAIEFFVGLKKSNDKALSIKSWRDMARSAAGAK
ncbi:hypothetical protein [Pseudomonas putida]